jgi:FtsH-binding integral membrane protein
MSDFDRNMGGRDTYANRATAVDAGQRAHMMRVYNYVAAAVALTGAVTWLIHRAAVTSTGTLTAFGRALYSGPTMVVLLLGTLGLMLLLNRRIHKLQFTTAMALFMTYSALLGMTLSSVVLVYTRVSTIRVFFVSAASFAVLSLWGYTTRRDLTGRGSFLLIGLFGIVLTSLVNILLLKSSILDFIISIVGVLIFLSLLWPYSKALGRVPSVGRPLL